MAAAAVAWALMPLTAAAASGDAKVIWTTNPILPNQTAILKTPAGAALSRSASIGLSLCDGDGSSCENVPLIDAWERSSKLLIPGTRAPGVVWSLRDGAAELARLNEAEPWSHVCHRSDSSAGTNDVGDPSYCKAGVSTLRLFGRGLGWAADGTCSNQTSAAPGRTVLRLLPTSGGDPRTLVSTTSTCYAASFELPSDLAPGDYSAAVKNSLRHATFAKLGARDPSQAVVRVVAAPVSTVVATVSAVDGVPALIHTLNGTVGQATPGHRLIVQLGAGTFSFGATESLIVPDGVHVRGAGMDKTVLEWPTQTGKLCLARKADRISNGSGPNPTPALVSSSTRTRRFQTHSPPVVLGWGLEGVAVRVIGGFQQNDTMAGSNPGLCPAITPCMESGCSHYSSYYGMDLRDLNVSIVAPTGGVDMRAGGVGMGSAVDMATGCSITGSTITTHGNCGSNVTPLLNLAGNNTLVRHNRFHNGCTIYSARSVVNLLWESTISHYYGRGGRGGNVIATFGPPYRVEYVMWLNNTQTNNPVLPDGSVVKNPPTNHRIEGLTLDGGGGAYTGGVPTL